MKLLITGGAGFIGSHVVKQFVKNYPDYTIYVVDSLTYAGNLHNLKEIANHKNYFFVRGDIRDNNFVESLFLEKKFDTVIHLAAESHVDRSISNPLVFVETNVIGTVNLLNSFKKIHSSCYKNKLFYHVSTDEVYGSLGEFGFFTEKSPYDPRSPYSASKASSDFFVRAYGETYNIPYLISNCSNNYGEYQFPEKLIPLFINNILMEKPLPVYGDGNYTRDWLYVKDHASAIDMLLHSGKTNQTFNIGGNNEWKNIDLVNLLCDLMDFKLKRSQCSSKKLINFVKDRPGHDKRYAIDSSKIFNEIGWEPTVNFEQGLSITIDWYLNNKKWMDDVNTGNYKKYNINN